MKGLVVGMDVEKAVQLLGAPERISGHCCTTKREDFVFADEYGRPLYCRCDCYYTLEDRDIKVRFEEGRVVEIVTSLLRDYDDEDGYLPAAKITAQRNALVMYFKTAPIDELIEKYRDGDDSGFGILHVGHLTPGAGASISCEEVYRGHEKWEGTIRNELIDLVHEEWRAKLGLEDCWL
jgi:hypothetical protein